MEDSKTNIRAGNTYSDSYIINIISDELNLSLVQISEKAKIKSGTLYRISSGTNRFSTNTMNKIMNAFPNINYSFLIRGEGHPTREGKQLTNQNNVLGRENEIDLQKEIFASLALLNKKITFLQLDIEEIKKALKEK